MSWETENLTGLLIYFVTIVGLVIFILVVSHFLGQRRRDKSTIEPFESGIVSVGDAKLRFSAPFFLVAIFFVIFDLEAVREIKWRLNLSFSRLPLFLFATT